MERERGIFRRILTRSIILYPVWFAAACMNEMPEEFCVRESCNTVIEFSCPKYLTKGMVPDEDKIQDINLLIFREGDLEDHIWEPGLSEHEDGRCIIPVDLIYGCSYDIYAFANFGRAVGRVNEEELKKLVYSIETPEDLYTGGLPMSAVSRNIRIEDNGRIHMTLERMVARISLKMDRSRLSDGIEINVRQVSIGNSPSNASVIESNKVLSIYDRFEKGWTLTGEECRPLNTTGRGGISEEVSLYMLENMQGDFPYTITEDEEKVFEENDDKGRLCSYIEIELEYHSPLHYVHEKNLIYRFYLGEGLQDLNIERNCHYHITISPDDEGLSGSGWRVDKTGIGTYIQGIDLSDEDICLTYKGEEYQLDAALIPADATDRRLCWESSDTLIVKVDSEGCLTAMGEGDCTILCKAQDGSNTEAQCEVNVKYAPPYFRMYPGEYIEGKVGDEIHIWCDFFPPNAPFNPGYEELDYDKSMGIYDYRIDEDGHGAVLTLRKPGTGIVLMSAGEPVNQSGMTIIVVNQH